MGNGPQMFRINPRNKDTQPLEEVDFADLDLRERPDIQEWIAAHPRVLGGDLLIIGKEFSGFDQTNERPDLLAVDREGKLVVIELKRGDSGEDVHWQAIRYASYFSRAGVEQIVDMLARYKGISDAEAESILLEHINDEALNALNHDQRIILVSHRFAPRVRSAVLWLNEKATSENLITCVQLTPYRDAEASLLFLQASTVISGPRIGIVRVGSSLRERGGKNPNASDEVTEFLRNVGELATDSLPEEIRPNKTSRWAYSYEGIRYYDFFYSRRPWGVGSGRDLYYRVHLSLPEEETSERKADVTFKMDMSEAMNVPFDFDDIIDRIGPHPYQQQVDDGLRRIRVNLGSGTLSDDFARKIADELRQLIETITPVVDELASESEGEA